MKPTNFPTNPFVLLSIGDKLGELPGRDLLSMVIKQAVWDGDTGAAINLCLECYRDNKRMALEVVGEKLMGEILTYCREKKEDYEPVPTLERYLNNPDDIPEGLYNRPGIGNYLAD